MRALSQIVYELGIIVRSLAIFIIAASSFSGVADSSYSVSGNLQLHAFDVHGESLAKMERSFELVVSNCSWQMKIIDTGTPKVIRDLAFWEVSCDGSDTYWLDVYDSTPTVRKVYDRKTKTLTDQAVALSPQARVEPGPIVPDRVALAAPLWLAFASQCVLESNTNGRLRQIWAFDDPNLVYSSHTLRATWELLEEEPRLPQRLVYYNDGTYYAHAKGKSVTFKAPPPYAQGWTNALYEVLGFTNVENRLFPSRVQFKRFAPKPKGVSAGELVAITVVDMFVDKIAWIANGMKTNPLAGITVVVKDNRFRSKISSPIAYVPTNTWLARDDVEQIPTFELQYKLAERNTPRSNRGKALAGYVVLISLIILPALIWLNNTRGRSMRRNDTQGVVQKLE